MAPNKGEIAIRGKLSALIEVGAGFHDELTGRENIYLNGTILGMKRREIDKKFDEIVEFSGLSEFIDTPVKRYSSGMWSRLGFSVAAHMDPEILLVDEVLAVGDMAFQAKCAQKMRDMLNSGVTIVLVSHNLSLIQNLCKRVILLHKGEILKEGPTEEVIPYYQNIVYKEREQEIKRKDVSSDYYVKVNEDTPVKILGVLIYDGEYNQKENFNIKEPISVKVNYEAGEKIENPVFSLDIIRSDGVLCCSSNTKDTGHKIGNIQGRNTIKIDLGRINLAPGIYLIKISVWDKDMLHPYVVSRKNTFRVNIDNFNRHSKAIFLPKIEWGLGDEKSILLANEMNIGQ